MKVTEAPSDSGIGARYLVKSASGRFEFGAQPALVTGPSVALVAWTDTRNAGSTAIHQEIFARTLHVEEESDRRGRWGAAGVCFLLLCIGLMTWRQRRVAVSGEAGSDRPAHRSSQSALR